MPTQTIETAADWNETELLSRLLLRDASGWTEFHRRYDRLIYRCIHKVTSRFPGSIGTEDVREIYAMLLLSLNKRDMHKLRSFDPNRGSRLSSWIGMLATNCAWDYLRTVARQPSTSPMADAERISAQDATPFDRVLERERWAVVNRVLKTFSEKDRTFVQLYYVDGLEAEEVANAMNISVKTVYSKKHKIRCRLEKALRPALEVRAA